ncbi:hypothetical protein FSPOR_5922 [Fusarium sporotrichioides]|uniref:Chromo domain-containing protein n=1 Tax=Fusarium sporotrichioides TaxID=5514 RepID=A0A395S6I9_FUSSP|nr:hypothetical protein FSPOR_5922 [Fusarium sporotrichioides]
MCTTYDPRIYDILSRWSFDPAKDASSSSHPQDRLLTSGLTASPDDLSQHSRAIDSADNHTCRRYSSIVNRLPTFDNGFPNENARTIPPGSDLNELRTTNRVTFHDTPSQKWPSPPTNLEVFRVIGYRTIFGRGYDEKNEFWVNWKGYPASESTWMSESLVRQIAPLQVADFNHERRLSCHRGACSNFSNLVLGFPGIRPVFIGKSDPLAEEVCGVVLTGIILVNNSKNVVLIEAGRFITSSKARLVPVDNVGDGLLNVDLWVPAPAAVRTHGVQFDGTSSGVDGVSGNACNKCTLIDGLRRVRFDGFGNSTVIVVVIVTA